MRKWKKFAYGAAAVAAAGLFAWYGWCGDGEEAIAAAAKEARRADVEVMTPNVRLERADGTAAELRDLYNEKPVLLVFWMPWSDDSKRQLEEAASLYEEYGRDMHLIMAVLGSDAGEARAYYEEKGYPMPFYTGEISAAGDLNVYEVPQLLVIRRGGAVSARRKGFVPARDLAYLLARSRKQP